eukprot:TRINITY_DN3863_c0_g1_i20.p1 TRINITY_DN3863_c0_g1~~TRINITY_DN3863_c0_g1_i20.p1  ORF type:complete len:541 (+),score=44.30 TRINITY_DN3863_c0_g1_i20:2414-4036(+)
MSYKTPPGKRPGFNGNLNNAKGIVKPVLPKPVRLPSKKSENQGHDNMPLVNSAKGGWSKPNADEPSPDSNSQLPTASVWGRKPGTGRPGTSDSGEPSTAASTDWASDDANAEMDFNQPLFVGHQPVAPASLPQTQSQPPPSPPQPPQPPPPAPPANRGAWEPPHAPGERQRGRGGRGERVNPPQEPPKPQGPRITQTQPFPTRPAQTAWRNTAAPAATVVPVLSGDWPEPGPGAQQVASPGPPSAPASQPAAPPPREEGPAEEKKAPMMQLKEQKEAMMRLAQEASHRREKDEEEAERARKERLQEKLAALNRKVQEEKEEKERAEREAREREQRALEEAQRAKEEAAAKEEAERQQREAEAASRQLSATSPGRGGKRGPKPGRTEMDWSLLRSSDRVQPPAPAAVPVDEAPLAWEGSDAAPFRGAGRGRGRGRTRGGRWDGNEAWLEPGLLRDESAFPQRGGRSARARGRGGVAGQSRGRDGEFDVVSPPDNHNAPAHFGGAEQQAQKPGERRRKTLGNQAVSLGVAHNLLEAKAAGTL